MPDIRRSREESPLRCPFATARTKRKTPRRRSTSANKVTQYRELQNTIFVAVRNAQIALVQDRAAISAAEEARNLAQQSYDDEVKKFQLGTSTAFNVVLKQQQLTAAEGIELRDRANLIEAEVNFNQAMGRTLDVNNIIVDGAARLRACPIFRERRLRRPKYPAGRGLSEPPAAISARSLR